MRFLADENVPLASVRILRLGGHDILYASETMPGAPDASLISRAQRDNRVIITFDRDFGELVFRDRLASPPGIIYLRFDPARPEEPAENIILLLNLPSLDLVGRLTVFTRTRIRQRPLP